MLHLLSSVYCPQNPQILYLLSSSSSSVQVCLSWFLLLSWCFTSTETIRFITNSSISDTQGNNEIGNAESPGPPPCSKSQLLSSESSDSWPLLKVAIIYDFPMKKSKRQQYYWIKLTLLKAQSLLMILLPTAQNVAFLKLHTATESYFLEFYNLFGFSLVWEITITCGPVFASHNNKV